MRMSSAAPDEERDREHDLQRRDGAEQPALAAGRRSCALPFSPWNRSGSEARAAGSTPGDAGGDDRGEKPEGEHRPADVDGVGARHRLSGDRLEQR